MKNPIKVMKAGLCAVGLAAGVAFQADATPAVPTSNNITPTSFAAVLTITNVPLGDTALIQYRDDSVDWSNLASQVVTKVPFTVVDQNYVSNRAYIVIGTPPATTVNPPPSGGMALIPAGAFTMGDVIDGGSHAHTVNVSAFYMDTNLVSLALWQQVYAYGTTHGYLFDHAGAGKAATHPVETVSWYDAVKWCNARSEMEGLVPCYYTDGTQRTVYGSADLNLNAACVNWAASGYRLPTEAEWEKAARGGLSGHRFPWGDTISEGQANYLGDMLAYPWDKGPNGYSQVYASGNSPYTSPVGAFAANAYGLRDMAGNVREWCWDWFYSNYYLSSPGSDPLGPASSSLAPAARILRGGGWNLLAVSAKCAARDHGRPADAGSNTGFRCVRAAAAQ